MKPIQYFSDAYLELSKKSSPSQIADFLEEYAKLHARPRQANEPSRLISLRMPASLLEGLKERAKKEGLPYQTWLKRVLEKELKLPLPPSR